ncbi:MAG: phosphoribosylaminoimidazolesuccinocarboxamide synthase [Bradymonadia bacterium]
MADGINLQALAAGDTLSPEIEAAIELALEAPLTGVDLPAGFGPRQRGKVRDAWAPTEGPFAGRRVLVTTDRISAFDRVLGHIPLKGQVLNQLSAWWFGAVADVVDHHMLGLPDPNTTLATNAAPLPVEVVVRGFITGVTSTSLWTLYDQGVDRPYGLDLPQGLKKNDALPTPVITPTTKGVEGAHDERLTCDEVVSRGLLDADLWAEVQRVALEIFTRGQQVALEAGLLLVDTKYEFGLVDGRLVLIDEIHTPDSSRYWLAADYEAAQSEGRGPEHFDKEYLRQWLAAQGYTGDGPSPALPTNLRRAVARRYIGAFLGLTGQPFEPGAQPAAPRITDALTSALQGHHGSL